MASGPPTILLVDDDPKHRRYMRLILEQAKYRVLQTDDGQAALSTLGRGQVDLAVIDLDMRGLGGEALMEAMREAGIVLPIVVTTEEASLDHAVTAMRLGAVNFLNKPFDRDAFAGAVAGGLATPAKAVPPPPAPAEEPRREEEAEARGPDTDVEVGPRLEEPATAPSVSEPTQAVIGEVREHLKAGALNLPMVSVVVRELRRVMDDPRHRVDRLVAVVERDQELAMRVIQRANNAAYAGFAKVTNLHNALVRLGGRAVLSVALRAMAERMCHGIRDPALESLAFDLWKRSVLVASAVRHLAKRTRSREPEEQYLMGLLSEIGEPFLVRFLDDLLNEKGQRATARQVRREIARNHCEVGAALLERWGLREDAVLMARYHHDRDKLPEFQDSEPETARMLRTLALARHAVGRFGSPIEDHPRLERTPAKVDDCLHALRLKEADIDWVVAEMHKEHPDPHAAEEEEEEEEEPAG